MIIKKEKSWAIVARCLMGAIFLIFGLDGYYNFLPLAAPSTKGAAFLLALKNSGYFFYFLKSLETLCGLFLVANFFIPLTLLILTPIIINIILFGIFLDPKTLPIPIILLICQSYLVWYYRDLFKVFFTYQYYTAPDTEGKANIVILDEREMGSIMEKRNFDSMNNLDIPKKASSD